MNLTKTATFLGDDSGAEFWLRGPHIFTHPVPPRYSKGRFLCNLAHFNRYVRRESRASHKKRQRASS
ncbi:MAG: hypothetical protein ACFB50_15705 [Rubrobacteraceae bacterium]